MEKITTSRLSVFNTCERAHHYRYELNKKPLVESEALTFGTAIHKGLEVWFTHMKRTGNAQIALDEALSAMRADWQSADEPDQFDWVRRSETITAYSQHWAQQEIEALDVEIEFTDPLLDAYGEISTEWQKAGKIDGIVKDKEGDVWILEHKTSSEDISPGSMYWSRLRLDAQVSMYYIGARSLGYDPVGCIYDVLPKPGIRPKLATPKDKRKFKKDGTLYANQSSEDETPADYGNRFREAITGGFVREKIVRNEQEMEEFDRDLRARIQDISIARTKRHIPRNLGSCWKYRRACEYMPVCCHETDINDPHLYRTVRKHEELAKKDEGKK